MLSVLGISGSPRKGNSEFLLEAALAAAKEIDPEEINIDQYSFRGKKFGPCISCFRCGDSGGDCILKDDFSELRDLWVKADVVIYSVPVYHMSIPGQLKCFIDRLGNSLFARYSRLFPEGKESLPKLMKVVGSIAQGVHLFSGQEHTLTDLVNHALLMQCIPVGGDMWESYIGAGGWTSNDIDRQALRNQVDDNLFDAKVGLKAAQDVGRRAVIQAQLIKAGGLALRDQLATDPAYKPFLARITGDLANL